MKITVQSNFVFLVCIFLKKLTLIICAGLNQSDFRSLSSLILGVVGFVVIFTSIQTLKQDQFDVLHV